MNLRLCVPPSLTTAPSTALPWSSTMRPVMLDSDAVGVLQQTVTLPLPARAPVKMGGLPNTAVPRGVAHSVKTTVGVS